MPKSVKELQKTLGFELVIHEFDTKKKSLRYSLIRNDGKREELCAEMTSSRKTFSLLGLSLFAKVYLDKPTSALEKLSEAEWKFLWDLDLSITNKKETSIFDKCPEAIVKKMKN